MAVDVRQPGSTSGSLEEIRTKMRDRINQAREHRKQLEPIWLSNLAFAAGQHWLVYDENHRQMRHIADMDPAYEERQLYTADKINEHVQAQLGEFATGDDRPELLLAQEGDTAEELQKELNDCAAHGWDHEWAAASALKQARRLCLKLGTSAIRVRFDPTKGPVKLHVPLGPDGQPVLDEQSLGHLEATGQLPDGTLPKFVPIHDGRTVWEPLSTFNTLTPPGVNHEDNFPWEGVMRPVLIDELIELYGDKAKGLTEDTDIASILGLSTSQQARTGGDRVGAHRLRDHVWLYTIYDRPCRSFPKGRVVVLASNQMGLLDIQEELPYKTVTDEYRTGIHYFHWWRRDDQFYSRAFIEPLKDAQRLINEVKTGGIEIMRRGYPKTFVKEGTLVHNPSGLPLEVIELKQDANEPNFFAGIGPGDWMFRLAAEAADDMSHASTLSALRLGENPTNVNTYAQLALLNENEAGKRSTILSEHEAAKAGALEDSMHDVRKYWPEQKQILVSGDEGAISQKMFSKSRIPDFYVVKPAEGSAKPRSQGAELTKVDAIWNAAVACGIATGPNAEKWIEWYAKSLEAGQALELPEVEADSQADMARFENFLMLDEGEDVEPADYDLLPVHLPIHREAQNQARAAGDMQAFARLQRHIDKSQQLIQANAARMAAAAQTPSPLAPVPPPPGPAAAPSPALSLAAAAAGPQAAPPTQGAL